MIYALLFSLCVNFLLPFFKEVIMCDKLRLTGLCCVYFAICVLVYRGRELVTIAYKFSANRDVCARVCMVMLLLLDWMS